MFHLAWQRWYIGADNNSIYETSRDKWLADYTFNHWKTGFIWGDSDQSPYGLLANWYTLRRSEKNDYRKANNRAPWGSIKSMFFLQWGSIVCKPFSLRKLSPSRGLYYWGGSIIGGGSIICFTVHYNRNFFCILRICILCMFMILYKIKLVWFYLSCALTRVWYEMI